MMKIFLVTMLVVVLVVVGTWLSFWIYAVLAARRDYKKHVHEKRMLCPACAVVDKGAAYHLIYRVRGEQVCENCGDRFVVTFSEETKKGGEG